MSRAARLTAVRRAGTALAGRAHGLQGLVELAAESLGVGYGALTLVDADQERFVTVGGALGASLPSSLPLEQSVCRLLVSTAAPLLVPDLREHPLLRGLLEVQALGLRSYAGAPVRDADGLVLGGLCVADTRARSWSAADAALLRGLAEAVGSELRLLVAAQELDAVRDRERRRAEEQAALHRVAVAVARGAPPDTVLAQVAQELVGLLEASTALVVRFVGSTTEVLVGATREAGVAAPGPERFADTLAEVRAHGAGRRTSAGDEVVTVVPVRVEGRTWGALVAVTEEHGQRDTTPYLQQLADFVSLVVVNTEATRLLQAAARTDPLTGAANRRAFEEQLAVELARVDRHGDPLLLALVDVDHFKRVNDLHGHDVGDRVLVELSARVGAQLRAVDLLARIGGDEWAVLLPETDREVGCAVLERVRASVASAPLAGVRVTVTIGAAGTRDGATTASALYRAADQALYGAKSRGRDSLGVSGPEDEQER